MTDPEKKEEEHTDTGNEWSEPEKDQDKKPKSLDNIKDYFQKNESDLKKIDLETYNVLYKDLEDLSILKGESELNVFWEKLESFIEQIKDDTQKGELKWYYENFLQEKEELLKLKKEIWEDTDKEWWEKNDWEEDKEQTKTDWWFKKNWGSVLKWSGIGAWIYTLARIKNYFKNKRAYKAYEKTGNQKKPKRYEPFKRRKWRKDARSVFPDNSSSSDWFLSKITKRALIWWWAVGTFFGIKWLIDYYNKEKIPPKEILPPVKKEDVKVITEEHEEEIVSLKNSKFKKVKKDDVEQKNDGSYCDDDGNKIDLIKNGLKQPLEVCYKKYIWRVVPDWDPNWNGYKELKDESGKWVQPTFVDWEKKPDEWEIYYLQFQDKKTEVATVAPIVEQLQKAIEDNKRWKNPLDPDAEMVGDLSDKRWDIWCSVFDNKDNKIENWKNLTEEEFKKKVKRVSITSWNWWYDEIWQEQQFSTNIWLVYSWNKTSFRIPNLGINLEKEEWSKDFSSLYTMVWLANLTNFCLYKHYWDKSDEWRNWNWLYKMANSIFGADWFTYIDSSDIWAVVHGLVVWYNTRGIVVVKEETMKSIFKDKKWKTMWKDNYWDEIANYLNIRMKQYEVFDEKLVSNWKIQSNFAKNETKEKHTTNNNTTKNKQSTVIIEWEEVPVLQM